MTPTGEVTEERPRPFGGKKPEKKVDQYIKDALNRDWSKEFEVTWKKKDRQG